MIDSQIFGNIVFLIIVGITIYHNTFIKKKTVSWFLIYIPLIILAFWISNITYNSIF